MAQPKFQLTHLFILVLGAPIDVMIDLVVASILAILAMPGLSKTNTATPTIARVSQDILGTLTDHLVAQNILMNPRM
jgi:hypothetical protein